MSNRSLSTRGISRRTMLRGSVSVGMLAMLTACASPSDALGGARPGEPAPGEAPVRPTADTEGTIDRKSVV